MAQDPNTLGAFAKDVGDELHKLDLRLTVIEDRQGRIVADRVTCNAAHTKQLEELRGDMDELRQIVQEHVQDERLRKASLDGLSKLLLAVAALLSAYSAALQLWGE